MTSKRVLVAISSIARGGGAEKVAVTVATEFGKRNIMTTLLTFYSTKDELSFDGKRISLGEPMRNSFFGKLFRAPRRIWNLKKVCAEQKVDTIVSFLEETNYYVVLSKILLGNSVKIIVSVRNNPDEYNLVYRFLIKYLYRFTDGVVSVSRGVEENLSKNFGLENVSHIYNPVDKDVVRHQLQADIASDHNHLFAQSEQVCTNVGRLVYQKGQWHLIRAFALVTKRLPTAKLVFIGEGPLRSLLEAHVYEHGLGDSVIFLGRQENVIPIVARSNLFILSSLWEGMPNALIEALSVGVPCIATDIPTGPREIMAPELVLSDKVTYPYRSTYGLLIKPFSHKDDSMDIKKAFSEEESILADSILSSLLGDNVFIQKKDFIEDVRFSMDSIIMQWVELL